jgi:SAM-dependent methyltransferase
MTVSEKQIREIRDGYLEPRGEWATSRVQRVLDAASVQPGERVLDLACNMGTFSFHTRQYGTRPIAVDRNYTALVEGREISTIVGAYAAPRVQSDALNLPFLDATFDIVINADFIEHTPGKAKLPIFQETYRVLKKGGRTVVYSPNLNKIRWELLGERIKRTVFLRSGPVPRWEDFVDPDHFGLTTPWKTAWRMRRAGLKTSVRYFLYHVPGLSRIPAVTGLTRPLLSAQFAERFLILGTK